MRSWARVLEESAPLQIQSIVQLLAACQKEGLPGVGESPNTAIFEIWSQRVLGALILAGSSCQISRLHTAVLHTVVENSSTQGLTEHGLLAR
jgi:hypothetical protein